MIKPKKRTPSHELRTRSASPTIKPIDDRKLAEVRGGWNDGGITAGDDWEVRN